ncbi:MAG: DoxX family protein [Candidatus Halalkalibacterium sp. M3_1C_030]
MMIDVLLRPDVYRYLIGAVFILAGLLHFLKPAFYIKIMPDYIPWHKAMVYLSGIAEIAGGIGILFPPVRYAAAIGLILLLVAVFPANIDMAVKAVRKRGWISLFSILMILRLPLQFVLMYWVYWAAIMH